MRQVARAVAGHRALSKEAVALQGMLAQVRERKRMPKPAASDVPSYCMEYIAL